MKKNLPKNFFSLFLRKNFLIKPGLFLAENNAGQALIVILLVMAVGLTVALAIISRSITDIRVSQQEEESARAFSVAEAALEQALVGGAGEYQVGSEGSAVVSEADECEGGGQTFNFGGEEFDEGKIQSVWLVEHAAGLPDPAGYSFPESGIITLCWGKAGTSEKVAVEASLIYQVGSEFRVARGAYDSQASRGNNFKLADNPGGGTTNCGGLEYSEDISLGSGDFNLPANAVPYLLRLKLFYNSDSQPITVFGNGANFPSQGEGYDVTASVGDGASAKIRHCLFYKSLPDNFDYVLFSEGSLSHN